MVHVPIAGMAAVHVPGRRDSHHLPTSLDLPSRSRNTAPNPPPPLLGKEESWPSATNDGGSSNTGPCAGEGGGGGAWIGVSPWLVKILLGGGWPVGPPSPKKIRGGGGAKRGSKGHKLISSTQMSGNFGPRVLFEGRISLVFCHHFAMFTVPRVSTDVAFHFVVPPNIGLWPDVFRFWKLVK